MSTVAYRTERSFSAPIDDIRTLLPANVALFGTWSEPPSCTRLGMSETQSRPTSVSSQATSTRPFLSSMSMSLDPPVAPFAQISSRSSTPMSSRAGSTDPTKKSGDSLSVNYLPTKFSNSMLNAGIRKRKNAAKVPLEAERMRRGGGVEAFRAGEARMPDAGDEDYDGVDLMNRDGRKMRWNKFKWALLVANTLLTAYSLGSLIVLILTWFDVFSSASIILVANRPELVVSTFFAVLGLFTALIGFAGILLNNRSFLAVYTFLLWIVLAVLVAPGYMAYKRRQLNLEGKVNLQWSRYLPPASRLTIQNHLGCCGYYSPFVEATASAACYARSVLPGCKLSFLRFERHVLQVWYSVVFSIVPVHLLVVVVGLLCSNHVTWRFGKGMMPKAYRLNEGSVGMIMESYVAQLADQYGHELASDVMMRSRSNLNLQMSSMKSMPLASPTEQPASLSPYDAVTGGRAPPSPDFVVGER